jgi:two-component system sensor histidine kinase TctE
MQLSGLEHGFRFFIWPFNSLAVSDEGRIVLPVYLISLLLLGVIVRRSQHLANKLQQSNEQLALSMETQKRFIENAAHQLRTPLAGLKLQVDNVLSADESDIMKHPLAQIKIAADRAAHLMTQLLVLARSESVSQSTKDFKNIDLSKLVRECCMEWVPKALIKGMELGFDGPVAALRITGDETLLRELISNLLDNAVFYGNVGGQINVKIELDSRIILIVEDDGPGIRLKEMEKVFERFYRLPGSPGDGCGLGLAIVKEIANLHSARINLGKSSFSQGTRFEIAFERR